MKPKKIIKLFIVLLIICGPLSGIFLYYYSILNLFGKGSVEFEVNYDTNFNYLPYFYLLKIKGENFGENHDASNITYQWWYQGILHHEGVTDAYGMITEDYYGDVADYQLRIVLSTGTEIINGVNFATTSLIEIDNSIRLEGTVMWLGQPFANEELDLLYYNPQTDLWDIATTITTDAFGQFIIEDVSGYGLLISGMYQLEFCSEFYIDQYSDTYTGVFDIIPTMILISSLFGMNIFLVRRKILGKKNLTKNKKDLSKINQKYNQKSIDFDSQFLTDLKNIRPKKKRLNLAHNELFFYF